uniref:Candidate secreted effector n=2 Tax=Meloidogyne TaxID=189290 RepID=A0A914KIF3_MELIC
MYLYLLIKLLFGASFCLFVIDAMPRNRRPQGQQGNQQQGNYPHGQYGQHNFYPPGPPIYYAPPILHPQPPMIVHHPPPHPFIPTVQLHPIVQPHPILTHPPPPAHYYHSMHQPGPPLPFLPPGDLAYATHHYHQYQPGWDQLLYQQWHQNNPVQSSMQYPENTTPHSGESSNIQVVQNDDDEKIFLPKSLEENDYELEEVKPRDQVEKIVRKDYGKKKGI